MDKTFLYFQPEYVSNFKCDGQACGAHCCKYWRIDIDKKTYKKYERIKPKSAADKITKCLVKGADGQYIFVLDENARCPMLTADNWCSIQKKYGEEYLSNTCVTYPRKTYLCGDFFERSLTLTCPVVAGQVLLNGEPMAFEWREVPEKIHSNLGRIHSPFAPVPQKLLKYVYQIQFAAISILQERSFSIDERLMILGFFFDKLDEIVSTDKLDEIENLTAFYVSEQFLLWEAPNIIENIKFDVKSHMKIMINVFETLYKGDSSFAVQDRIFIDAVIDSLEMRLTENDQISLDELVTSYNRLEELRKIVFKLFSNIFENYLINEFFYGFYPWRFQNSIIHNYGIFLTSYKMLELVAVSVALFNFKQNPDKIPCLNEIDLAAIIMKFVSNIDHNQEYIKKISEQLMDKPDIVTLMQSLLKKSDERMGT